MRTPFLATLLLGLFLLICTPPASALENGTAAPDFKLPDLDGKKVSLSDYKGKIVILKLATTWCPTCKQQAKEIADLGPYLKENDVAVVEVFLQDTEAMIREHLQGTDYPMPHVVLLGDNKVAKAYNVYVIPRLLVLDRDLKVRRDGSLISANDLKRTVQEIAGGGG